MLFRKDVSRKAVLAFEKVMNASIGIELSSLPQREINFVEEISLATIAVKYGVCEGGAKST